MKKKIIGYVISFLIALTFVLLVCGLNGLLTQQKSPQDTAKILCDAFFVAAALFLGYCGLSWASTKGAFDGLGYSISTFFDAHMPTKRRLTWQKKKVIKTISRESKRREKIKNR